MIKLSVITINRNNQSGLARTLKSVSEQTFRGFEYLVIDGASSDGSRQLLEENQSLIRYWVSEPDNGIYHAMNKGIRAATGEYCLFLNSGDWLTEPTTLEKVFAQNPEADIVSGDVYFYDTQANAIKWEVPSPDILTAKTLFLGTLPHQATFIRRKLFDQFGLYNETLRIASDWLFFVEALLVNNCTYQHHKAVVAYFSMDGISCDPLTGSLPRREQVAVLREKYPRFLPDYEHLAALELQHQTWLQSREYRIYLVLKNSGVIRAGVLLRRLLRALKRTFGTAKLTSYRPEIID